MKLNTTQKDNVQTFLQGGSSGLASPTEAHPI
jgi:hypothetical protein